ncbi:hypothetical protein NHX12_003605, partial [Muraenolepis orangiensis]
RREAVEALISKQEVPISFMLCLHPPVSAPVRRSAELRGNLKRPRFLFGGPSGDTAQNQKKKWRSKRVPELRWADQNPEVTSGPETRF